MSARPSPSRWLLLLTISALVLCWGRPARADAGSALSRLAQRISSVSPTTPAFAAVAPLGGVELATQERSALDTKLARVLGSAVTGTRGRGETAMSADAARLRARQLRLALVLLTPTLKNGQLTVDVDVIEWELSFWARSRKPAGTVVAHASFSEPADAEIRRYLPRPRGLLGSEQRFTAPERGAIGLSCGDVRGDGASELLVIGRRNLFLGSLTRAPSGQRGSFSVRRTTPWDGVSPLSPHPLRAPLAAAWFDPGRLLVGSSDRAALVGFDAELGQPQFMAPALPIAAGRCHALTTTGLSGEPRACGPLAKVAPEAAAPAELPSHDAVAFLAHTDERGIVVTYQLVSSKSGELTLTIESPLEERRVHRLPKGGAQIALADLDGDAIVEAITTTSSESSQDAIQVHTLTPTGPVLVATRPVGAVRALAVCPFEGQNPQRLAVLLDDEIRILE